MNIALWVLAGAVIGWIAFAKIGWNDGRSLVVSIILGTIGGFFGGKILAPMFAAAGPPSSDFAMLPLVFAILTALVFVVVADQSLKRWDL
jgi:uncharacterized membrane protein YeaQ/YmgE (transglycosylase-associated protein family)